MTCAREVEEELGLTRPVGRLLCIEWQGPEPDRSESMMLVYDGGVLPESQEVHLPSDELASHQFVDPGALGDFLEERLVRRVGAALEALNEGTVAELEYGVRGGDQRSDGFVAEVACRGASSVVVSSVEGSACDKVTL